MQTVAETESSKQTCTASQMFCICILAEVAKTNTKTGGKLKCKYLSVSAFTCIHMKGSVLAQFKM